MVLGSRRSPKGNGSGVRPTINGSSVRTQFYWVLHQELRFLGSRILNIIIFIIINIINQIVTKLGKNILNIEKQP